MIKLNKGTGEDCIKIYEQEGKIKDEDKDKAEQDARLGFAMPESVELAIQMLDNSHFRPTSKTTIKVTEAQFTQKGEEYVPKKV